MFVCSLAQITASCSMTLTSGATALGSVLVSDLPKLAGCGRLASAFPSFSPLVTIPTHPLSHF